MNLAELKADRALAKDELSRVLAQKRRIDARVDALLGDIDRLNIEISANEILSEAVNLTPNPAGATYIFFADERASGADRNSAVIS